MKPLAVLILMALLLLSVPRSSHGQSFASSEIVIDTGVFACDGFSHLAGANYTTTATAARIVGYEIWFGRSVLDGVTAVAGDSGAQVTVESTGATIAWLPSDVYSNNRATGPHTVMFPAGTYLAFPSGTRPLIKFFCAGGGLGQFQFRWFILPGP